MSLALNGKQPLHINYDLCLNCSRCLAQKACTVKAIIRIDKDEPPFVDVHRCHGCLLCLTECPTSAIQSTNE